MRREDGGVRGQGDRGQCPTIHAVAHHEFSGEVLGISGATTIAEE
jgi:hypothetical protein